MAPTSNTEPAPVKHITLHNFLKQQLQQHHRLKPATVMWGWPAAAAAAAAAIARHAPEDAVDDDDGLGGTWPPRSYTCAFCRREFRSAQALGGHMNVHRRDRAKMRGGNHGGGAAAHAQLVAAAAPATGETAHAAAAAAATKYAVLYPILDSNNAAGAVLIPSGDVLLSAPVALAPAHDRCDVSDDEEEGDGKDVDLELRLWWP
ncbi:unnamed protein product [Urochloa decumbens]|uniref:C2H2-type domain-containing protein n=1 Tax=Urochloa decumbens TaxID=240449 RepID=A0ABC9D2B8_9POAL